MDEQQLENVMATSIRLTCEGLDYRELVTLRLALSMGGIKPHHFGYDKIKSLFTESDGTEMHPETARLLRLVIGGMILDRQEAS